MDVSKGTLVERIARVLAGQRTSANAGGWDEHAGDAVDESWRDYLDDARAVLKTMREPDEAMARIGDVAAWERMVLVAIEESERASG